MGEVITKQCMHSQAAGAKGINHRPSRYCIGDAMR